MDEARIKPEPVEGASKPHDFVGDLRASVTRALIDGSRNNPLIYYRDNRSTRFTIAPLGSKLVTQLLGGDLLRSRDFEREPPTASGDSATPASTDESLAGRARADADPLVSRLRKIQAKAREDEQERGLRTLFAAIGMVSWPAADDGRPPLAPLFLVPIAIEDDRTARGELVVRRLDESETLVNRALFSVAPPVFGDVLRRLFDDGTIDDVDAGYHAVESALHDIPAISVKPTAVMGIFNFALMAMIEDLRQSGDALSGHAVIRALAGDPLAQQALVGERDGAVDVNTLDAIPPAQEPFVLDADPWQAQSIQTLRQFPGSHAVIEGPPGTGKSQTIGNLIASFIAQGLSVLFVCEKRAALDVVKQRLSAAGLGHLVLDMHGADITRQRVYAQLKRAAAKMGDAAPPSSASDAPLVETRERLNAHMRFMHTPVMGAAMSPFQILGELAALPKLALSMRLTPAELKALTPDVLERLQNNAREAAASAPMFLRSQDAPWATATLAENNATAAIACVAQVAVLLPKLRNAFGEAGIDIRTRAQLLSVLEPFRSARAALAVCGPGILDEDPRRLSLALATLSSPFGPLLERFFGDRQTAMHALREHLLAPEASRSQCAGALTALIALDNPWRSGARTLAALSPDFDLAAAQIAASLSEADKALGKPLTEDLDAATAWSERCANDRAGAFRAVRMREIEQDFAAHNFGALAAEFSGRPPESWAQAVRCVWLQSLLELLRPELMRFNGRTQDALVSKFVGLEAELRDVSRQRVCRAAAERYIAMCTAHRDQDAMVRIELEKSRPRKPLRALFAEAQAVMLALAPCVMASPLSVSQLLPRATIFDVVIFDEGSQVTPESAVTAILRGRRVVVAGDERQLPPSDFFQVPVDADDDDDENERIAIAGTESILGALRPFCKPLGLRVHYRSRDERLIAFSNHHLYEDNLITFPGSGADDQGLRFMHVQASGSEFDDQSSSPEVARVVELIFEHAQTRPGESLGVIALGLTHARRIETALGAARREHPELDSFFTESGQEPFFIKNLERVQGDERDAIILTIGYGRTKTGNVSRNFGPINQAGGERRLNVAITRAKSRLTLVASFCKADLNPESLSSVGAKLLAAYLGYVETGGKDLGRDGVDVTVPPNPFEHDIQKALETRLVTGILPQYGVGRFRIDLAVQHPTQPGRFVLAVECDGASYHSTPTARMRDRLRQRVLEDLGWHFCRIWSTDWFNDRERELDRVEAVYRSALAAAPEIVKTFAPREVSNAPSYDVAPKDVPPERLRTSPAQPPYRSIDDVTDEELTRLLARLRSESPEVSDTDLPGMMRSELGFQRLGTRIRERIERTIGDNRR